MAKNQSQSEVNFDRMSDREKWDYGPSNERAAAALAVNFFFTEAYGKIDADQSGFVTQSELKAATANTNLSREQRQTATFIDKNFDKFDRVNIHNETVVDVSEISYFAKQVAIHAKSTSDSVVANGFEKDLLAYGKETGVTQTYYMPGVAQDAKRLSSWMQTNFAAMDLDKDGVVEPKEMDALESASNPLSQTVEFKTARLNWHELTHLVEQGESESGYSLKDAGALNEAFDPLAKKVAYETWKQELLSSERMQKFGPITAVSTLFTPFLVAGAFGGPAGWAIDGLILGGIALAEGAVYLAYRQDANFIKARTADNYYEMQRRNIIGNNVLGRLHED